jgi:hypothetical protein
MWTDVISAVKAIAGSHGIPAMPWAFTLASMRHPSPKTIEHSCGKDERTHGHKSSDRWLPARHAPASQLR